MTDQNPQDHEANEPNEANQTPDPQDHSHDHDHAHSHDHDHDHDAGHAHHHDHDHDHDHDPLHPEIGQAVDLDELDPANKSLAEALQVSFRVLSYIMIVLVVSYLFSGVYEVKEGEVGVLLVFGAVAGEPGNQESPPGWHIAPPAPIAQVVVVPSQSETIDINEFFVLRRPGEETKSLDELSGSPSLVPGVEGSLITGDRSIVQGKWRVSFQITDAVAFTRNVSADTGKVIPPGESIPVPKMREDAKRFVRNIALRAIVHLTAQVTAEDFISGFSKNKSARKKAVRMMNEELSRLDAGIEVTQVLLTQPTPPLSIRGAYQAVSSAESEKAQAISEAQQLRTEILNEVAGPNFQTLLDAIDEYELARAAKHETAIASADKNIVTILDELKAGEASKLIREAQTYKTQAKAEVQTEVNKFKELLPKYRQNPRLYVLKEWLDVRQDILANAKETFYLPSGPNKSLYLEINRDPRIQKEAMRKKLTADIDREQTIRAGGNPDE